MKSSSLTQFRSLSRYIVTLILLVIVAIYFRAIFTTVTGLSVFQRHFHGVSVGLFQSHPVPVPFRTPEEQADFWLTATESLLDTHFDDLEVLAIGAAVLQRPMPPYREIQLGEGVPGPRIRFQFDKIIEDHSEFDRRCFFRRQELLDRVLELGATNVMGARLNARMLRPFDPDRDAILRRCREHDPDNGLYDYYEASIHWSESSQIIATDDSRNRLPVTLQVRDVARFQRGIECFEIGQGKAFCRFGEASTVASCDYSALQRFLSAANVTAIECSPELLASIVGDSLHLSNSSFYRIFSEAVDYQVASAFALIESGRTKSGLSELEKVLIMLEQLDGDLWMTHERFVLPFSMGNAGNHIFEYATSANDSITEVQLKQFTMRIDRAHQYLRRLKQQTENAGQRQDDNFAKSTFVRYPLVSLVVGIVPLLIVVLSVMSCVAWCIGKVCDSGIRYPLPLYVSPLIFAIAFATSIFLLGMIPAGAISRQAMGAMVILFPILALVCFITKMAGKDRQFKRGMGYVRFSVILVAVCITFACLVHGFGQKAAFIEFLRIEARDWNDFSSEEHRDRIVDIGFVYWSAIQWMSHNGPWVAIGLWLTLTTPWHVYAAEKTSMQHNRFWAWRRQVGMAGNSIAYSVAPVLVLLVIAYLLLSPAIFQDSDLRFHNALLGAPDFFSCESI